MTDSIKRIVDGIDRDFETNIVPWLRKHVHMTGDPADRTIKYMRRLVEFQREGS